MTKNRKKGKVIDSILIIGALSLLGFSAYKLVPELKDAHSASEQADKIQSIISENSDDAENPSDETDTVFTQSAYNELLGINSNFVGYLEFDAGIVKEPVVQTPDEEQYFLRRSFDGSYNELGTPFMDIRCTTDSQNMTIYGHNVEYNENIMFSPIRRLQNEDYLNENRTYKFYLNNGIVRSYQIEYVYFLTEDSDFDFDRPDFVSEDDFNDWIGYAKKHSLCTPLSECTYEDKYITFQTCQQRDSSTHVIVIAKEIGRNTYQ